MICSALNRSFGAVTHAECHETILAADRAVIMICLGCHRGMALALSTSMPVRQPAMPEPARTVQLVQPEPPAIEPMVQPEPGPFPTPKLDVATLARIVREALPEAEACALGLEYLAGHCDSDAKQVEAMLASLGMTIFKAPMSFQGRVQREVSVNKKLRAWAEKGGAHERRNEEAIDAGQQGYPAPPSCTGQEAEPYGP
ncbi:hypothetical protein [Desulfocurvibacter africanus]|uniref:Uncharacterized protein n=1 Tax=Desulfocurvibacter africanus subsp. africanus str. Walvis Bay TaxID=690850 RepID=F3YVZ5_DESAF|nr:hypothetical protein [Desulfocurvibacter africanus]EGJ49025.1 hypothetical protein Desaf_0673 [Desulfocurvibacter africanus subsp. africanus str. Walvis Bay]